MIDWIGLGVLATLLYIATKIAVVNDMTHEIRDLMLKDRRPPPSPPPEAPYDAEKHSECYPFM